MIAEIVTQLKTGTITNVVPFGSVTTMPTSPYVVVKPETYINGRGIRVITHYTVGTQLYTKNGVIYTPLDDYVYNELVTLLNNFSFTNNHGENMTVKDTGTVVDISVISDDNTVSMERLFYIPQITL